MDFKSPSDFTRPRGDAQRRGQRVRDIEAIDHRMVEKRRYAERAGGASRLSFARKRCRVKLWRGGVRGRRWSNDYELYFRVERSGVFNYAYRVF